MRLLGGSLGVPIKVYATETYITEIIPLVLGVARDGAIKTPAVLTSTPVTPTSKSRPPLKVETSEPAIGEIQPSGERVQPNDQIIHFEHYW